MWRSKKFIVITALLVVIMVGGAIGGITYARADNENDNTPQGRHGALLSRVCEIYAENTGVTIDQEQLENAFNQAHQELHADRPAGMPYFKAPAEILEKLGITEQEFQDAFNQALNELGEETRGPEQHKEVMNRVMEILGVAEADWQQAWTEAMEARCENGNGLPPGMPPRPHFHGGPFGPGGPPPQDS
jgi:hypothetical protein